MDCPHCKTPNRSGANFCKHCGTPLFQNCPRCTFDLPPEAQYCDHCGLRLVDPPDFSWWGSTHNGAAFLPGEQAENPPGFTPTSRPKPSLAAPQSMGASQPREAFHPLQQYIPGELLDKLEGARTRGEMVGERRVVTMLFCDVMGSTAAAENLDPEEWTEIINGAFEHMIRPVYKYEGTVARLMGDGILAFFGAPITHEDEPQRAVLAGLDIVAAIQEYREFIKQRYGLDFNVRVGINTGLVVVGAVGSDLRMEYTALGDAINLAARMEQTARTGTVQVAHDTYKLIKSMFDFEELGGIEVKGKTEPVPAYRVIGRKAVSGRSRGIEGLHAQMVGRKAELSMLSDVVGNLKQGIGRVVCILGEAGMGKSRLVSETQIVFNDIPSLYGDWFETTSLSYETNQAYALIKRLIRQIAGIAYEDRSVEIREKLLMVIENFSVETRPRSKQTFETLFGLENGSVGFRLEGESFKRELFEIMDRWWRKIFTTRPAVLVFDDLHWSDSASIDLLQQLLPLTGEIPLVLLCAMRSERQAPAWQIKTLAEEELHHRYIEMTLQPLSEAESSELVDRLLVNAELPESLRAGILEKVGGNPFFIEEVVRTLIDTGTVVPEERLVDGKMVRFWRSTNQGSDFPLPDNLQALLASRIDRLEENTRGTLQLAAVIGRSFYHRVLAAVDESSTGLEKRLGTLLRMDMIREAARVPEVEYTFRNPMTQEAVYQSILLKRRRAFHLRVGDALEALYPERMEGFHSLLAYHYALAGERGKSIRYSLLAAKQAAGLYAYHDALQNLLAARELVDDGVDTETRLELFEDLGDVYRLLRDGEQAIAYYHHALSMSVRLTNPDPMVTLRLNRKIVQVINDLKWSVSLDFLKGVQDSRTAARNALLAGLEVLDVHEPQVETVRVLTVLSNDAWRIQEPPDWQAAQGYAQEAVDKADRIDSPLERSKALGALATVLDGRSLLREHLSVTQQRLEICRQPDFDDLSEITEALRSTGAAHLYVGEYEQALSYLLEMEELAVQTHTVEQQASVLGLQAQCWFRLDRWDEVLQTEEKWRDLERRYSRERVGET